MGHVSVQRTRLMLVALLPILILWLAFAGGAHAATPTGDTINGTHQSTKWKSGPTPADGIYSAGIGTMYELCGPTAVNDPTCDHFQLTTQVAGSVRVTATWPCDAADPICATSACVLAADACTSPDLNDFDILVCDNSMIDTGETSPPIPDGMGGFLPNPTNPSNIPPDRCTGGTEVKLFDSNTSGIESGVFTAVAGKTYEIRVVPIIMTMPGTDYKGCAEYTNVTLLTCAISPQEAPTPVTTSAFFTCDPDQPAGPLSRQVDGSGAIPSLPGSTNPNANFSLSVRRKIDSKGTHFKGKVNYGSNHDVRFRSEDARCATFIDGTNTKDSDPPTRRGSVEVHGFGKVKLDDLHSYQRVCYKAFGDDWGQPGAGRDHFRIELYTFDPMSGECTGLVHINGNTLTDGNIKYKFQPEGKDD
jgi:hypothetical protein